MKKITLAIIFLFASISLFLIILFVFSQYSLSQIESFKIKKDRAEIVKVPILQEANINSFDISSDGKYIFFLSYIQPNYSQTEFYQYEITTGFSKKIDLNYTMFSPNNLLAAQNENEIYLKMHPLENPLGENRIFKVNSSGNVLETYTIINPACAPYLNDSSNKFLGINLNFDKQTPQISPAYLITGNNFIVLRNCVSTTEAVYKDSKRFLIPSQATVRETLEHSNRFSIGDYNIFTVYVKHAWAEFECEKYMETIIYNDTSYYSSKRNCVHGINYPASFNFENWVYFIEGNSLYRLQ